MSSNAECFEIFHNFHLCFNLFIWSIACEVLLAIACAGPGIAIIYVMSFAYYNPLGPGVLVSVDL